MKKVGSAAKYLCVIIFSMLLWAPHLQAENPAGYCRGNECPIEPPGTLNHEYPFPICLKEYHCWGTYVQKTVANLCGCCGCNGGSCGCAGGTIICCDGTLSQMCGCHFRLTE